MAEDFVPYPDMPGETSRSNAAVAVDKSNAQWAKTFEGGTTNLATRARHTQDIQQYASDLEAQRMDAQAKNLATNKEAQNFYIRSKTLQLNEEKAHFDMADKRAKADAAIKMAPLMFQAKEAQTNAQIANAARVAQQTAAQSKIDAAADTFHAKVSEAQATYAPDSPEYERAIVAAGNEHGIARHDKAINDQFMAAQKSLTSRSAVQSKADAEKQDRADREIRATQAGLTRDTVGPMGDRFSKPTHERDTTGPKIDAWQGKAIKAKDDPELKAFYEGKISEAKAKVQTQNPIAPIKAKFVDGKLVTE